MIIVGNILAILTSALLSHNFHEIPSTISLDRVLYFYKFIVEYIIWIEYKVERIYISQKHKFNTIKDYKVNTLKMKRRGRDS